MATVKDPVCGMEIEAKEAAATATHQGHTYHFCSPMCKTKFTMNPGRYAAQDQGGHQHGAPHGH